MEFGFRKDLRFLYIWDRDCPSRTLTIARKLDGDNILTTYCVNKVVPAKVAYQQDNYVPRNIVLDPFNKRKARHICSARFDAGGDHIVKVPVVKEQRHIENIINYYAHRGRVESTKKHGAPAFSNIDVRVSDTAREVCARSLQFRSRTLQEAQRMEKGLLPALRFGEPIPNSRPAYPVQMSEGHPILFGSSDMNTTHE